MTWLSNNTFHTLTTTTLENDELILARIGAADPQQNLRRDPVLILRRSDTKSTVFASVVETHGGYDAVTESARNSRSSISKLEVVHDSESYLAVIIESLKGSRSLFIVAADGREDLSHRMTVTGVPVEWTGPVHFASLIETK